MAALASDWLRHFQLLLWNRWTEFNETWQEARSQSLLPSLCFSGRSTKTRWAPWPLIGWYIFDFFSETAEWNSTKLDRKQDLNVFYQFCYLGRSLKQDGRPGLWLAETVSSSSLKSMNGIQQNLTGSKLLTSSIKIVFYGPILKTRRPPWPLDWLRHLRLLLWNGWTEFNETWQEARSKHFLPILLLGPIAKTRWPPWPLIGWDSFDFFPEINERNSTKLDRKQTLNVFFQVCVFRANLKNKRAALASDWLRHFRLLVWNRWTEFITTWQERINQCPLPSLCFSGRSEK